ncbi:LysR family transcriptional regulator [Klebsiella quasipneumoniae]|uniref:LysR family transcriptional regulator n=1 Tax=Klebsiella quasipneumoniae TaxID=1463165 RepID=UPI000C7C2FCF|nr:LysR family transcriptional regulator [Klebsiella quasipneumoniae]PLG87696.1 LysR family transcriptional regulator [Klebsiella quasipneumoniae]
MTIPLTIKQIEMLVKISEGKGLSEAARLLNLSPSAVSKGLAVMEENLGVPLIQRTTRSFQLTEAGEYFVSRASELLKEFDDIINTTCGYFNHPHGALKVTSSVAFGYAHLIDIFEEYRKKNHNVELILELDDHLTNLNENNVDIALRVTATPPQNYAARKLSKISWLYCASPDYLARMGSPTKRAELESHECLIYPGLTPPLRYNDIVSPHPQCAIKPRTPVQANSSLLLLKAALSGQGIAWLPSYLISQHIDAGELVPLKLDGKYAYPTHSLYALYFPSKFRNPKVRSFIDFLVEENQPWNHWEKAIDNLL